MNFSLISTLLRNPTAGWERVRQSDFSIAQFYAKYVVPLSLITAIAAYIGTSQIGWRVLRTQPINATLELNRSAGVSYSNVFRGLSLSRLATLFS